MKISSKARKKQFITIVLSAFLQKLAIDCVMSVDYLQYKIFLPGAVQFLPGAVQFSWPLYSQ